MSTILNYVTGWKLTSHGTIWSTNKRFFCSSKCTELLWGLPPLFSRNWWLFAGLQHATNRSQPPSA